jgi:hypothetical protein
MIPRPQRLTHHAPPGSLLKSFAPVTPRRIWIATEVDEAYLALVRQCPCLCCGLDPCGEAAHVRYASAAYGKASGLQKRPPDKWALPLCGDDHRVAKTSQHNRNEQEFWASLGINALATFKRLHLQAGDLVAMRAVVMTAIAERGK